MDTEIPLEMPPFLTDWVNTLIAEPLITAEKIPSNEINAVFRLVYLDQVAFLKYGPRLAAEHRNLQWLAGRQPCPTPLGFASFGETDALLMSAVAGQDLTELLGIAPPEEIVRRLVRALKTLHATPLEDWSPSTISDSSVLVHGDACLPNILYDGDSLSGFIDLGDMRVDNPEVDLAAAVWTLQRNLGPGYGLIFLHEYGRKDATEADVARLRQAYQDA